MTTRTRTIMVACAIVLILTGIALALMPRLGEGGPLTGDGQMGRAQPVDDHGGGHAPCTSNSLPKFLRNTDIECERGSENWFKGDVSRLRKGNRTDSVLWINNHTRDGRGARIVAWGCGHTYKLNDEPPILAGSSGAASTRETNCNLSGHVTARETKYSGLYKRNDHASRHHDGGDGGGGGGGGAF